MHRTTINLDESIYLRVKQLSARRGKSLARTIEDLLRVSLGTDGAAQPPELPKHVGNGPKPGVNIADRDRLYDFMDR